MNCDENKSQHEIICLTAVLTLKFEPHIYMHINTRITEKPHIKFSWRCLMSTAAHQPCTKAFISNECNTAVDPGLLPPPHIFTLSFVPLLHTTDSCFLTFNWTRNLWGLLGWSSCFLGLLSNHLCVQACWPPPTISLWLNAIELSIFSDCWELFKPFLIQRWKKNDQWMGHRIAQWLAHECSKYMYNISL